MRLKFFITAASLCLPAHLAYAHNWLLVLPESYAGNRDELADPVGDLATRLGQGDPGDQLVVVVGSSPVRELATVKRPSGDAASNPAWVRRKIEERLAPVMAFIEAMPSSASDGRPLSSIPITAVLGEVGQTIVSSLPGRTADVLLIASYKMPDADNVAMASNHYPLDENLQQPEQVDIYGTKGLERRLAGVTVHWCGIGDSEFANSAQAIAIKRFWSKWIHAQSGVVGTMSNIVPACIKRWAAHETAGQIDYAAVADAAPVMVNPVAPPASPPAPAPVPTPQPQAVLKEPDAPLPPVTPKPTTVTPVETPPGEDFHACPTASTGKGISWVGISWLTKNVDLDLYIHGRADFPWLFYGNVQTDEARFGHDWTAATGKQHAEYTSFYKPFDPAIGAAFVNLYASEATARIVGMVRVCMDGKSYHGTFTITARHGNRGAGPMTGPYWVRLDLLKIVHQSQLRAER